MSQDIGFEQRWEFRNRESESSNDDSETSSNRGSALRKDRLKFLTRGNNPSGDDDPNSSSSNAPLLKKRKLDFLNKESESMSYSSESSSPTGRQIPKKHKLVADLMAVKSDMQGFCHKNDAKDKGNAGARNWNHSKRPNRRKSTCKEIVPVNSERERGFYEDMNSIKSNSVAYESTIMDDLYIFGKSVIKELEAGRERIFEYMKEELHGVLADDCGAKGKEMQFYGQLSVDRGRLKQKKRLLKDTNIDPRHVRRPTLIQYSRKCKKDVGLQHQKCFLEKIKADQPLAIKNTDGGLKFESSGKAKGTIGFLGGSVQRRELFNSVGSFQELPNQGNPRHFFGSYLSPRVMTRRRIVVLGLVRNPTLIFRSVHFRPSKLPMILRAPSCSNSPLQNSVNINRTFGSNQQGVPENRVRVKIGSVNTPTTLMKRDNGQGQRMFSTMNSINRGYNPVAASKNFSSPAVFRETYSKNCRAIASFDPEKVKAALGPSSIILALCSPVRYNPRKQQEERNGNCSKNRRVSLEIASHHS